MPQWLLDTIGTLLGVGPSVTIVLWGYVWYRVEQSSREIPTLRAGQALAEAQPPTGRVCVVVPAWNEARSIAALIRSLRAETYPDLRVVLALDRCTDASPQLAQAEIAGDDRFEIVAIDACPEQWAGKVHAVHAGVTRSRGAADAEFLLFADADTTFSPGCIAAALALMRERRLDLLSLLSTLTYDAWFERVAQMAASFELMRQYPLQLANAQDHRRAFANGQFMLFRKGAYDAIGGHEAVKGALLEDLALARLIEATRRRAGVFIAAGLFRCRMYATWAEFRRGWKRIFTEAANRKPRRLSQLAWRIRVLGTIVPAWTLVACAAVVPVMARDAGLGWRLAGFCLPALVIWLGALLRIAALARAPAWTAPLHIVGAWITAGLYDEAAADLRRSKPTSWGGREYDLTADKV